MDWIMVILNKYKKEDGTIDLVSAEQEIRAEFPKNAIVKSVFNEQTEQLKTANETINKLQKGNKDNEELQAEITGYKSRITELETEAQTNAMTYQARTALDKAGIMDVEYGLYLLGELETDKDGNVINLDNKIKTLQIEKPSFFEVKQEEKPAAGYKVNDNKLDNGSTNSSLEAQAIADVSKALGLAVED